MKRHKQSLVHGLAQTIFAPITDDEQKTIVDNYRLLYGEALYVCKRYGLTYADIENVINGWSLPKFVGTMRHFDPKRGSKLSTLFYNSCRRDSKNLWKWIERSYMTPITALSVEVLTNEDSQPDWWHPATNDTVPRYSPEALCAEVEALPRRTQAIISQYYWQGMTLEEVGQWHDITRERVRQILDKSYKLLRRRLERGEERTETGQGGTEAGRSGVGSAKRV